jgi:hypothetical protein
LCTWCQFQIWVLTSSPTVTRKLSVSLCVFRAPLHPAVAVVHFTRDTPSLGGQEEGCVAPARHCGQRLDERGVTELEGLIDVHVPRPVLGSSQCWTQKRDLVTTEAAEYVYMCLCPVIFCMGLLSILDYIS